MVSIPSFTLTPLLGTKILQRYWVFNFMLARLGRYYNGIDLSEKNNN